MANADRASGLAPVSYLNGAKWTGGGRVYSILSSDTNAYAIGDPVLMAGTADTNGVANVVIATAGGTNPISGVIVGMGAVNYGAGYGDPASPNAVIIPATKTKNYYVLVEDDPNIIFECQETNSGTAFAATDVGANCSLKVGTNNGFVSGWTLDNTTQATTSTLQAKLLGLVQRRDNAFGAAAKWLILINNHSYRTGVTGV